MAGDENRSDGAGSTGREQTEQTTARTNARDPVRSQEDRGSADGAARADGDGAEALAQQGEQLATGTQRPGEQAAKPFFVVGVGASAGGLDALGALLKNLTLDSMAVVVVQHLAPKHDSVLPALLSRGTHLQVVAAEDGMQVCPNHVYVIPPNADLAILHGVLQLMPLGAGHRAHLPVDYFFRSLAQDQGPRAIGIVLSGTGSDGTFGLQAIKEAGGITYVQDPASAKYDGMPRNALDSGFADFCLTPEDIARELMSAGKHTQARPRTIAPQAQESLAKLLVMIRSAFGHDLTFYKSSTIERRIERRMALHKTEKLEDYVRFVQSNPEELRLLYKDMLIGVTSFFRDRDPFEAFKASVLPQLLEQKEAGAPLRLWVPACSTGEEAYSFAISILEYLDDHAKDYRVQIFGTDIDETAIQVARRGVYPLNIALDVSPERLQRFFVKGENEYQIARRVRDMVVFSVQNVAKDAPFSRLDMVSCRNLLIYLQPPMQRKVLRILHYAIQPGGVLMLGTSETVGDSTELFSLVDRKNKLYTRKQAIALSSLDIGFGVHAQETMPTTLPRLVTRPGSNLAALADRKVLELFGPPGVVVNEELDVLHIRGRTGPFLDPTPGAPSFNLLRLARPEIHVDLRRAIHEAQQKRTRVSIDSKLVDEGSTRAFKLEVVPLSDPETKTRSLLVMFHEPALPDNGPVSDLTAAVADPQDQRLQELERELLMTKEYLQSTVEELESANEELKSSNEELQSSNEELQSTNEELETSKEELQSANEELTTVNDELQNRMGELQQTNDDLHNVLTGVGNAVVIVGMDLRIRRFTHVAERLLNLLPGDVGRSVSQLNAFIMGRRIEHVAASVIENLIPIEEEVLCADQRWYTLRVTPYKTLDHTIKGALISLIDDDAKKRAVDLDRGIADYANNFLAVVPSPLMILDRRLRVVWVNEPFLQTFHLSNEETVGTVLSLVGGGEWSQPKLLDLVESTVTAAVPFRSCPITATFAGLGERSFHVSGSRIPPVGQESILVLLAIESSGRVADKREETL